MENTLYLECYSGISGDMTVAALLDLGADQEVLLQGLASLQVDGYTISITQTSKCGIQAKKFDVLLNHVHHEHGHPHNHDHEHIHRNLKDIQEIISNSSITDKSKRIACNIFQVVAEAEAKVHGKTLEKVHFHEVGAIDSIIDIVAVAICLDNLSINNVILSPIYEGTGHVKCQHGIIPVPVPAVVEIAKNYDLSLQITENKGEMITPTGAAIAAACKTMEALPENYLFKKIGIGAGTKDFAKANILRAFIVETKFEEKQPREIASSTLQDEVVVMECNVDDMTGEELGFTLEVILEAGALDAYFTPIFMKKNRPAYMFSVICNPNHLGQMKKLIFQYTSTLGIRMAHCERKIMNRRFTSFNSSLGEVRVKLAEFEDVRKETLEYEDIRRIAKEYKMSVNEVYKRIMFEYTSEF